MLLAILNAKVKILCDQPDSALSARGFSVETTL